MNNIIEKYFKISKETKGDIEEHMDILKLYASKCNNITELGTRKIVSTWAFLAGNPKKMTCIDITHPNDYGVGEIYNDLIISCKEENINFNFILADDLTIELEETDLLFIDTNHYYNQLNQELQLHGNKAKKYLIFHDTEIKEMTTAIFEFIKNNPQWIIIEYLHNNNGLIVLERIYE
jgi:hypothetical protein